MEPGTINHFFRNQTVFITGGTGFLGKLMIEKLLRVNQIQKIFILVRAKRNKSSEERFQDLFDYPCFDNLKKERPDFKEKIVFVSGDCELSNLGMSQQSQEMLIDETDVVIHAAANVKFDQPLRLGANINVRSTKEVLALAKLMPRLKALVYVSTAYSNCPNNRIEECFYKAPISWQNLLSTVDALDDDTLEKITPELLGEWPNCYTFTKSVAEDLIRTEAKNLPAVIVRPAIVTSTIEEPMPGWTDNFYGVAGIVLGAALGVLRSVNAKKDAIAQLVPCDYTVNAILAAAWNVATERKNTKDHFKNSVSATSSQVKIYNYVGTSTNQITWKTYMELIESCAWDYPSTKLLWYYCFTLRENELWHKTCVFFLHTVVAYLADFVLLCIRRKPLAVTNYARMDRLLNLTSYFAKRNWKFPHDNVDQLWGKMCEEDRKVYKFDMSQTNWANYIENCVIGGRLYLLKDPLETIPEGRKWLKTLQIAHYSLLGVLFFLLYLLFKWVFSSIF
ncbi:unnamed protein product [Tenebrio molitor]|nr:unnamed protein product [Tenebrio molitor]